MANESSRQEGFDLGLQRIWRQHQAPWGNRVVAYPPFLKKTVRTALIVGLVLFFINHFDEVLTGVSRDVDQGSNDLPGSILRLKLGRPHRNTASATETRLLSID